MSLLCCMLLCSFFIPCAVVQDKETFTVQVLDVNQGGLVCRCQSLQAFIPISQLNRERDTWLSPEVSCSACCALEPTLDSARFARFALT